MELPESPSEAGSDAEFMKGVCGDLAKSSMPPPATAKIPAPGTPGPAAAATPGSGPSAATTPAPMTPTTGVPTSSTPGFQGPNADGGEPAPKRLKPGLQSPKRWEFKLPLAKISAGGIASHAFVLFVFLLWSCLRERGSVCVGFHLLSRHYMIVLVHAHSALEAKRTCCS